MEKQLQLDFSTASPVNVSRLTGQNRRLYDYLSTGNKIHCFHPAMQHLRIGYLNSRISDLVHKCNVPVEKKWIWITDEAGGKTDVVEYSLIM